MLLCLVTFSCEIPACRSERDSQTRHCVNESSGTGKQGSQDARNTGAIENASRDASGNGRVRGQGQHRPGDGCGTESTVAIGVARSLPATNENSTIKSLV